MLEPTLIQLKEKKLVGTRLTMSLAEDRTGELFRSFMPRKREIPDVKSAEVFALRVYDKSYDFRNFNPRAPFQKWAAAEVNAITHIPAEMEPFSLEDGLYAIFHYQGRSTDTEIFRYIYGQWLTNSIYDLDNRPHFEVLGEKYRNNDPESEEDIWIPVKPK